MYHMYGVRWVVESEIQRGIELGDLVDTGREITIVRRESFLKNAMHQCWREAARIAVRSGHEIISSHTVYNAGEAVVVCRFYDSLDLQIQELKKKIDSYKR